MKKVASESKNLRKLENSGKVEENKKTATSKRIDRSIDLVRPAYGSRKGKWLSKDWLSDRSCLEWWGDGRQDASLS